MEANATEIASRGVDGDALAAASASCQIEGETVTGTGGVLETVSATPLLENETCRRLVFFGGGGKKIEREVSWFLERLSANPPELHHRFWSVGARSHVMAVGQAECLQQQLGDSWSVEAMVKIYRSRSWIGC